MPGQVHGDGEWVIGEGCWGRGICGNIRGGNLFSRENSGRISIKNNDRSGISIYDTNNLTVNH